MEADAEFALKASKDWARRFRIDRFETWPGLLELHGLVLVALAMLFLVGAHMTAFATPGGRELSPGLLAAGSGTAGWALFQAGRILRVRARQTQFKQRDARGQEARRLCVTELFAWLFISLAVLALAAFLSRNPVPGLGFGIDLDIAWQRIVFLTLVFAAFVPVAFGIYATERDVANTQRGGKLLRDDAISPGSLLFGALAMGLIVLLAWAAGRQAFQSIGPDMGVLATLFIVFAFVFFIVISSITRGLNLFSERGRSKPPVAAAGPAFALSPAKWASWLDSILVRLVAPMTGATQAPDGRHGLGWHHLYVIGVMTPLTALGYALPEPWGLIPIFLAFLFALAVGRRWAWIEGDRETAARLRTTKGQDIHVGFGNDLRDEAMLAYAYLFILVPLTLFQLNEMTGAFTLRSELVRDQTFVDWIQFFGLELFKAVPLVDWAEIYGFTPQPNIIEAHPDATIGKHLIFGARVLVDFVVMAALFQAISIVQRNSAQRKLYDSGQLDVLDPITEEDFFERGIEPATAEEYAAWKEAPATDQPQNPVVMLAENSFFKAKRAFVERVERHVNSQSATVKWPYSRDRLNELVTDHRDDVKAGARWMIAKYSLLAGDPKNQIWQLADRWSGLNLPRASEATALTEKQNFEQVLIDARNRASTVSNAELGRLAFMIAEAKDRPEFGYANILAIDLIGKTRTEMSVLLLALTVMTNDHLNDAPEILAAMDASIGFPRPALRQRWDEMRVHAYTALQAIGVNVNASKAARKRALDVVVFMEAVEARKSAAAARQAKIAILKSFRTRTP
ncbi:hypothetical protein [Hyphomonas johnsonii]|uniref:Uncharacterized protein n=1 Tax=Hyphomonas johnsonii MHS-2 TaxID=1280950 RepID=A0A059FM17_9PROT|nr:hypothetical protein [Hyphomonas johnsonii]KCZ91652.1 hypothetical protein HJO_11062 [Hyphomonas johnsonii MHS-2]